MKLVRDWKQAWRWLSVNCMVLAATIQGAWMAIPDDLRAAMPIWLGSATTIVLLVLGVAGRLVHQPVKDKDVEPIS